MRAQESYWSRRLNRRRVIGSATAVGIGTASLALVGCGDDDDDGAATPTTGTGTGASPSASTGASPSAEARQRGGVARFTSANATYDTFDADRTRFGPMGTLLGLTQMGVVGWENYAASKISGYFAESVEQPDNTTFVFKVRQGLAWHNKAPVNGRAANARDIVYHIERNKKGTTLDGKPDSNFYRKDLYGVVETATAVDERTVQVKMTKPWPYFLNTLAGTWSKVQAPEAVEKFEPDFNKFSADLIIGTGNFQLSEFKSDGTLKFTRFDKAVQQPWWDEIDYVPLFTDAAAQQAAFEQRQIDAFAPTQKAVLDDIKKRLEGKVYEKAVFATNPVSGTYYGGNAPWQDQRLIGAIYQVMDRRGLIQQLLQGRGAMSSYVPPGWAPFAIPEKELVTYPGYLEDRNKDYGDAKAKWTAASGDKLGKITVDIPDIFEGAYSGVSALITNHLKGIFGNDFEAKIEPYATITSKIVAQKYGNGTNNIWFGWVNPPDDPDPSLNFINGLNSKSLNYKQFEVKMDNMDAITDKLAVEFDSQKRIELCHEAGREVIKYNGAGLLPLYLQISNILYWNYMHIGESTHFVTAQNVARDNWFDLKDPTWAGRA